MRKFLMSGGAFVIATAVAAAFASSQCRKANISGEQQLAVAPVWIYVFFEEAREWGRGVFVNWVSSACPRDVRPNESNPTVAPAVNLPSTKEVSASVIPTRVKDPVIRCEKTTISVSCTLSDISTQSGNFEMYLQNRANEAFGGQFHFAIWDPSTKEVACEFWSYGFMTVPGGFWDTFYHCDALKNGRHLEIIIDKHPGREHWTLQASPAEQPKGYVESASAP